MFVSLCWLLVAIAYKAEGRVDKDFSKCSEFFFKNEQPVGFNGIAQSHDFEELPDQIKETDLTSPAYICQTFGGRSYYATLYDRGRRIPLYSAYILDRKDKGKGEDCNRANTFKLEPQLIYREVTENNMQSIPDMKKTLSGYKKQKKILERDPKNWHNNLIECSQAVDSDYTGEKDNTKPDDKNKRCRKRGSRIIKTDGENTSSNKPGGSSITYNRGHLNPCGHHTEKNNYLSTFTFTNVVPMVIELNGKAWSQYEDKMTTIAAQCGKMYVVTGVVPGNNDLNDRVTIPTYVWNAYCCVDNLGKPIKSGGAIAANDKGLITNNKYEVQEMELSALQDKLEYHLKVLNIEIFPCDCKVQKGHKRCQSN